LGTGRDEGRGQQTGQGEESAHSVSAR
jgi:hypothetical protein